MRYERIATAIVALMLLLPLFLIVGYVFVGSVLGPSDVQP